MGKFRESSVTEWCQKCNKLVVFVSCTCSPWFQHWLLLRTRYGCHWTSVVEHLCTSCTTFEALAYRSTVVVSVVSSTNNGKFSAENLLRGGGNKKKTKIVPLPQC